jgi:hypothetical protein
MKRLIVVLLALSLIPTNAYAKVKIERFSKCELLNEVYPHGVAKKGYVEKGNGLTGEPFVNNKLYEANKGRDRDKDNVACER